MHHCHTTTWQEPRLPGSRLKADMRAGMFVSVLVSMPAGCWCCHDQGSLQPDMISIRQDFSSVCVCVGYLPSERQGLILLQGSSGSTV